MSELPGPRVLYPPIECRAAGHLDVGDDHEIYYEDCGNPAGLPVVFLHGGPGSSIGVQHRRFFDPQAYRIILFDQRGCGRSRPAGCVSANTTRDLIADMERLRLHLGIDRWVVFGGSWGSTLALSYFAAHSSRVLGLILRGVFLATQAEVQWFCEGLRAFVPEAWARYVADIPVPDTTSIIAQYSVWIESPTAYAAARRWTDYESAVMAIGEAAGTSGGNASEAELARMRVHLHYLRNGCFIDRPLLDGAHRIEVPCVIVQGRRDLVCPPGAAYALHRAIRGSELAMVESGGHSAMHPAMMAALVQATDGLRDKVKMPS